MPIIRCECKVLPLDSVVLRPEERCRTCTGLGWVQVELSQEQGIRAAKCLECLGSADCSRCGGTGEFRSFQTCIECSGTGLCQHCPPLPQPLRSAWEQLMAEDD